MLADEFDSKKFSQFILEKDKRLVHIRNKQRNGKKSFTMVEGLATDLDIVKILKCLRKMLATNGTLLKDENNQVVLQLQGFFFEIFFVKLFFTGDFRSEVAIFLESHCICDKDQIRVHGV